MRDLSIFSVFFVVIVLQRMIELSIAKKNENWMKQQGAIEFGKNHYFIMIMMHAMFLVAFISEKVFLNKSLSPNWGILISIFFMTQLGRIWVIGSLGKYWNTKILVLPNAKVVIKGPYRYIRHPNYAIVSLEILIIPLLFQAYITAALFSIFNITMLSIRIPEEEHALENLTEYNVSFSGCNRFLPKLLNKYDS